MASPRFYTWSEVWTTTAIAQRHAVREIKFMGDPVTTNNQLVYFNGVDINTGNYLSSPMSVDAFAGTALKQTKQVSMPTGVARVAAALPVLPESIFLPLNFDPTKLEEAGWGVVFRYDADPAICEALRPLLDLRKAQASRINPDRYKEYSGLDGWLAADTADTFLLRHGAMPDHVDPDRVPYYLLIAGDTGAIDSHQLWVDVHRAIGHLYFDTPEEYASYARSVVAAEGGSRPLPRRAALFAPSFDPATELSCEQLAIPLAGTLRADRPAWQVDTLTVGDATKERLEQLLGGSDTAALVFTATHGGMLDCGDAQQTRRQGALICQGFDSEKVHSKDPSYKPSDFFMCGEDLADDALIPPMITFHFACFGAGTPMFDQYLANELLAAPQNTPSNPLDSARLAPKAFVAYLPQRLLGHPGGGVLATIGHIERAWGFTFQGDSLSTFENALTAIMDGVPVGHAMKSFQKLYFELRTKLVAETIKATIPGQFDAQSYVALWTTCTDAHNYVILGDPAVRLTLSPTGA